MADNEKSTRRPGRPRKTEDHPVEATEPVQAPSATVEDENAAMGEQIKYQLTALIKMAQRMGIDLDELYEAPPKDTTVVLEQADETTYLERPEAIVDAGNNRPAGRPKPGTVMPGGSWIPWTKNDLDPNEVMEFVPQPVPSLVFPMLDDEGNQKIRLDVNDLVCWLTVGVPNRVNKMFFHAYKNAYDQWKELEDFKRKGPKYAPWGTHGPDGRPAWHYEPAAVTFGLDEDGRYLTRARSPLYLNREETEGAI